MKSSDLDYMHKMAKHLLAKELGEKTRKPRIPSHLTSERHNFVVDNLNIIAQQRADEFLYIIKHS